VTPKPFVTLVCGFGRCGSSLVMQMLDAGGIPGTGKYPAFEPEETAVVLHGETLDKAWLAAQVGKAVKVLDPQRGRLPAGVPIRAIWMSRNPDQQAASQAKLMGSMFAGFGIPLPREDRRALIRGYKADMPRVRRVLKNAGAPDPMYASFEHALACPGGFAYAVDKHLGGGLDTAAMEAVVVRRGPECQPDMALELRLIREREARGVQA
jgi:hypothetical protein